jgi:myo-inositol-1(or 4)-monophosphatase
MDYQDELETAHEAALAASDHVVSVAGTDLRASATTKTSVNDLVTDADRASQETIQAVIAEAFPDDAVMGEEGDQQASTDADRQWVVDPIDGTSNFATGFPYYCVSIAFRVGGETKVGLVYSPVPALGRVWYAVAGAGAYLSDDPTTLDGDPISVTDHDDLEGALVFGRLSERDAARREVDLAIAAELLDRDVKFRRAASAALNVCMVASGYADGYVILSINDWDVAAANLILQEAGGIASVRDSRLQDNLEVVATNGHLDAALETVVASQFE